MSHASMVYVQQTVVETVSFKTNSSKTILNVIMNINIYGYPHNIG